MAVLRLHTITIGQRCEWPKSAVRSAGQALSLHSSKELDFHGRCATDPTATERKAWFKSPRAVGNIESSRCYGVFTAPSRRYGLTATPLDWLRQREYYTKLKHALRDAEDGNFPNIVRERWTMSQLQSFFLPSIFGEIVIRAADQGPGSACLTTPSITIHNMHFFALLSVFCLVFTLGHASASGPELDARALGIADIPACGVCAQLHCLISLLTIHSLSA